MLVQKDRIPVCHHKPVVEKGKDKQGNGYGVQQCHPPLPLLDGAAQSEFAVRHHRKAGKAKKITDRTQKKVHETSA